MPGKGASVQREASVLRCRWATGYPTLSRGLAARLCYVLVLQGEVDCGMDRQRETAMEIVVLSLIAGTVVAVGAWLATCDSPPARRE